MLDNVIELPSAKSNHPPQTLLVEVDELHQFSKVVRTLGTGKWIFRGHEDASWRLATSLERQMVAGDIRPRNPAVANALQSGKYGKYKSSDEQYAIETFKRLASGKLPQLTHDVEWLAAMQHYGAKTRLLDFTRSIYVATYFAFENRLATTDAAIYALKFGDLIANEDIRKEIVAFRVDNSGRNSKERLESRAYWEENYASNNCGLQDALIHIAEQAIKRKIYQEGVVPISVPGVNERLVAQSGLFLMPLKFTSFEENLKTSLGLEKEDIRNPSQKFDFSMYPGEKNILTEAALIKIVIKRSLKDAIWNLLDQANISALNLFPGLEGMAKSIRYSESLFEID